MTWRERILHWLGVDSAIFAQAKEIKALKNRCGNAETALATIRLDLRDHNTRLLDLRDAIVKFETKPEASKPEPEVLEPAGSWARVKARASRGADAA